MIERMAAEFSKALTFMSCTVLMQVHTPKGCASTAFSVMQWSGSVAFVLGRNVEYTLLGWFDVSPKLGAAGFAGFPAVAAVCFLWRIGTAAALVLVAVPRLYEADAAGAPTPSADETELKAAKRA